MVSLRTKIRSMPEQMKLDNARRYVQNVTNVSQLARDIDIEKNKLYSFRGGVDNLTDEELECLFSYIGMAGEAVRAPQYIPPVPMIPAGIDWAPLGNGWDQAFWIETGIAVPNLTRVSQKPAA